MVFAVFTIILLIVVLAAWLISIQLFIKVGAAKGYKMENKGMLWFLGIFATPIVVGLYVAALPDNRDAGKNESSSPAAEQLPAL